MANPYRAAAEEIVDMYLNRIGDDESPLPTDYEIESIIRKHLPEVEWVDDDGDCYTRHINANVWHAKTTTGTWRWEIWDGAIEEQLIMSGDCITRDRAKAAAEAALAKLKTNKEKP